MTKPKNYTIQVLDFSTTRCKEKAHSTFHSACNDANLEDSIFTCCVFLSVSCRRIEKLRCNRIYRVSLNTWDRENN